MRTDGTAPARLRAVLRPVLEAIAGTSGLEYRLVGTAAALAQGVPLHPGDVDLLLARRDDVDRLAAALSGLPCTLPPTWLADARQYFARFRVAGTDVEISTVEWPAGTDTVECAGPGPWRHYVPVRLGSHVVPAVRLELRLVSELVRRRADRYTVLLGHLRAHGADQQLVRRAMRDRQVDPELQRQVVEHLARSS
ncbi:hypothetical protein [Jidongwangia harbinensis]|uniref:hypothetical protein n=1 Tax=Jidongwangia harbinensis TaxID=2878561 RepID=UPI001CDA4F9E|nr:hypothetical protein [Jidongwangia harbinensis]MCA2215259.1 hypothetical protein [Jidongwangia harbinensis]